ncbi:YlmC/YmxH family sporulation protein [Lutispora thermophila]|uniref:Sporulation protein, YlmC/YmxH family n=1 Tax=Lutispora thermophila DSM 19022 TaxID=1122184 RepID=A0A1M6CNT5_9FIRM|nr:YlmC/YmxH family sporulation protein [Lutispora thermophila]SHI62640.1 sporulation protein, YlmC/YmxH family [Lutispora thermophila DSM 19022]
MFKASELRQKEIINMSDGKRLGFVSDVEINMETGAIEAIIIPSESKLFRVIAKDNDIVIPWENIKKIGVDVILIDRNSQ